MGRFVVGWMSGVVVAGGLLALPALAAPGGLPTAVAHSDSSPEWERLRERLFPGRRVETGAGRVQLIVPLRAAYGASVPVKIVSKLPQSPDLYVKRMVLLVDKNPSPVAAVFDFTPDVGQADVETRLRVDEYSHVRVVAELSNGELHTDSRYVKVFPAAYAPVVIEPSVRDGRSGFDLTAARDCPYCRIYEAFLARNANELVPHFAREYLVVDLRSALSVTGEAIDFKVDATSLSYKAFLQRIGDERARLLVYPSVRLFDHDRKPLMQMPAGTGTAQTVAEQLEILRLEQ